MLTLTWVVVIVSGTVALGLATYWFVSVVTEARYWRRVAALRRRQLQDEINARNSQFKDIREKTRWP